MNILHEEIFCLDEEDFILQYASQKNHSCEAPDDDRPKRTLNVRCGREEEGNEADVVFLSGVCWRSSIGRAADL